MFSKLLLSTLLALQVVTVPSQGGYWTTPTFAAGNYTASAGTWTVASGNIITNEYTVVGKTEHFVFSIQNTSTSSAGAGLLAVIPGGFTANKTSFNIIRVKSAGTNAIGIVFTVAGTNTLNFAIDAAGTGFAVSTSNADVQGEITFEIQ